MEVTASIITGCGGGSSSTQTPSGGSAASAGGEESAVEKAGDAGGKESFSGENVTLTIMDGYAPEDPHGQYIYQYAEEFMKEHPEIKVEIQAIASGDFYTKLAVIALLFTWIMNPMYGVLNDILRNLAVISANISWLGSKGLAFPSVVFACIWKGFPLVIPPENVHGQRGEAF